MFGGAILATGMECSATARDGHSISTGRVHRMDFVLTALPLLGERTALAKIDRVRDELRTDFTICRKD